MNWPIKGLHLAENHRGVTVCWSGLRVTIGHSSTSGRNFWPIFFGFFPLWQKKSTWVNVLLNNLWTYCGIMLPPLLSLQNNHLQRSKSHFVRFLAYISVQANFWQMWDICFTTFRNVRHFSDHVRHLPFCHVRKIRNA